MIFKPGRKAAEKYTFFNMEKFQSISSFQQLNENEINRFVGGFIAHTTELKTTVVTSTAHCTCNDNVPDNCVDTGQGTVCVPDK